MTPLFFTFIFASLLPLICRSENNLPQLKLPLLHMPKMPTLDFPKMMAQINGNDIAEEDIVPCTCGVFLSGQVEKRSKSQPKGNAALLQELPDVFQCNAVGERQCKNKCLETMMPHISKSPVMICGSIDRDCNKERAYLFVKNCQDTWINSNMSAGKEYCCQDGQPIKCT